MIRVRYRHGVVGETRRVVHVAWTDEDSMAHALCGAQLSLADAEAINDGGMPCMQCTARAALAAAESDQSGTTLPSGAIFDE